MCCGFWLLSLYKTERAYAIFISQAAAKDKSAVWQLRSLSLLLFPQHN
ncbi:hypothetical protein MITSMUL_03279 [Mitsuokella multacida DSM 20544]|uniref:Uncharacterized protein n=1 Tax=Mitsuokella multacida DSM 20544 TaxID=500635 RepID=C9KIM8_9FIRM|nr:hypothetical protein MITSMUL_03279 [Mitsuokella multacida DSM 20544]